MYLTVQQIIDKLQEFPDKSIPVCFPFETQDKTYSLFPVRKIELTGYNPRFEISFDEGKKTDIVIIS